MREQVVYTTIAYPGLVHVEDEDALGWMIKRNRDELGAQMMQYLLDIQKKDFIETGLDTVSGTVLVASTFHYGRFRIEEEFPKEGWQERFIEDNGRCLEFGLTMNMSPYQFTFRLIEGIDEDQRLMIDDDS